MEKYSEKYWHCSVKMSGSKKYAVVNDISFEELDKQVIQPWLQSRPFTVEGTIIRFQDQVEEIRIASTPNPKHVYAEAHNARMKASNVIDAATDRRLLPIKQGTDRTFELLFSGKTEPSIDADIALIERVCKRIAFAASILTNRQRKGKTSYQIEDEYDVQDLLHCVLRAYLKFSVQEDPLQKVAGTRSGRSDISIEDLGIIIEIKYVYGPNDQKRIFDDFSKDLVLYSAWSPLKTLLYVIYNSADLRDPEALEKLDGRKEVGGKKFDTKIILA